MTIETTYSEDFAQRFWARVDQSDPDGCWPWLGSDNGRDGRGKVHVRYEGVTSTGKRRRVQAYAYVVSWRLTNGPIPDGLKVCHDCPGGDNPNCVNPAHLFLGTQAENIRDMHAKGVADPFGHRKEKRLGVHVNRRRGERIGQASV